MPTPTEPEKDDSRHETETHELPPLPVFRARARSQSKRHGGSVKVAPNTLTPIPDGGSPPAFQPLAPISSRLSARSYVDSLSLVGALPEIARQETRTRTVRSEKNGKVEEEEVQEIVQITEDGLEITFPDGGREAYLVLLGGFCAAFTAFGMAASIGSFQTYYHTHFLQGYSSGILMTGASTGAVIIPIINANVPQSIGFGWTMRLLALIFGLLDLSAFLLMKTRLPPKPPGPFFYLQAWKSLAYCFICLAFFAFVFGFFSFLFFIGTYGQLAGVGTLAPYLLTITNGSSGIGRLVAGTLGDRIGPYNVTIMGNTIMVCMYFGWLGCKSSASLIVLSIIMGFASGALVSLQAPIVVRLATDMRFGATMVGQALMVQSFGNLLGAPISGSLLGTGTREQQLDNFYKPIVLGACMLMLSTVMLLAAKLKIDSQLFAAV
ncbi:hypothetical protein P7C73_g6297, partial [Tremellales sp. Uapishka_1]